MNADSRRVVYKEQVSILVTASDFRTTFGISPRDILLTERLSILFVLRCDCCFGAFEGKETVLIFIIWAASLETYVSNSKQAFVKEEQHAQKDERDAESGQTHANLCKI